ncbi:MULTISPECIES: hypothetical protein [unclassified Nonomuraea]|uniref:hypothetical protein n=1 Tax=unclassified Nonomuraea TaxID=2593643 RepID=UPI0034119521
MTRDTKVVRLALIPGDGIGPEVVAATVPALQSALEVDGHRLDVTSFDLLNTMESQGWNL